LLHRNATRCPMSVTGLGCVKTPRRGEPIEWTFRQIAISAVRILERSQFLSIRERSFSSFSSFWGFHTAWVISLGGDRGQGPVYVRSTSDRVTRLQPMQLPTRAARQLPDQSTTLRVESSSIDDSRLRGALPIADSCTATKQSHCAAAMARPRRTEFHAPRSPVLYRTVGRPRVPWELPQFSAVGS
jgi:hypothetical protein